MTVTGGRLYWQFVVHVWHTKDKTNDCIYYTDQVGQCVAPFPCVVAFQSRVYREMVLADINTTDVVVGGSCGIDQFLAFIRETPSRHCRCFNHIWDLGCCSHESLFPLMFEALVCLAFPHECFLVWTHKCRISATRPYLLCCRIATAHRPARYFVSPMGWAVVWCSPGVLITESFSNP